MLQRKKGAIINMSSIGAFVPPALLSVYCGTKAYISQFTEGIEIEYGSKGITVQCIESGFVVTNMSILDKSSFMIPMPNTFVESALNRLGIYSNTTGFWQHDMIKVMNMILPRWLLRKYFWNELMVFAARGDVRDAKFDKKE